MSGLRKAYLFLAVTVCVSVMLVLDFVPHVPHSSGWTMLVTGHVVLVLLWALLTMRAFSRADRV